MKTKPWLIACAFLATSAYGQNSSEPTPQPSCEQPKCHPTPSCEDAVPHCEQPKPVECAAPCKPTPCPEFNIEHPTTAAYNFPARTHVRCAWDVWVDASFIYWQAIQENMEPAAIINNMTDLTELVFQKLPSTSDQTNVSIINMNNKFKPGFKIGTGMYFDYDNWDSGIEYTRFTSMVHRAGDTDLTYIPLLTDPSTAFAFLLISDYTPGVSVDRFKSKWQLSMNFADWDLGRWYYVGQNLTMRPAIGVRGAWIKQKLHAYYQADDKQDHFVASNDNRVKTKSWGVGPSAGLKTNWMMGEGFRLFGNGFADILFTRYKYFNHQQFNASDNTFTNTIKNTKINTLRTHLSLDLGLGWGSYFDCNAWYVDFAASYGFQVFFDQNMFRHVDSVFVPASTAPHGNLYIHGATLTASLDF